MGKLQFWLSKGTKDRLQFPVNPEDYSVRESTNHTYAEVTTLGEVSTIGTKMLAEVSFESFFPRDYAGGVCEYRNIPDPWQTVKRIKQWLADRVPLDLVITSTGISMKVIIDDFEYAEKAGEMGDVYFSITLKEYRPPTIRTWEPSKPTGGSGVGGGVWHTVKKGDTLSSIAHKYYGNSSKWQLIYDQNKKIIGANPNKLLVGQKLYVPSVTSSPTTATGYQTFTIRSGDTLYEIARAYGTTVASLQLLNPSLKPTALQVGQKVKIPANLTQKWVPKRL